MADKGKYHGQRLKARDVLQLYAAGERDFRGTILRGQNFYGADLSGADFSRADIRSTRFVDATLQEVKFCGTRCGLQQRWLFIHLVSICIISAASGFLQALFGNLYRGVLLETYSLESIVVTIVYLIVVIIVYITVALQGFSLRTLVYIATTIIGAFASAGTVALAGEGTVAIASAFSIAGAVTGAIAGAITFAVAGKVISVIAITTALTSASTFLLVSNNPDIFLMWYGFAIATIVAIASLLISIRINQRICQNDPKFENLRTLNLAFSALGGTTFSGANLTNAYFTDAFLESVNFSDSRKNTTKFNYIRWHHVQKIERARLGNSDLQDLRIRETLITLNGNNKDLSKTNFEDTNLVEVQLRGANLKGANLNRAKLYDAQLYNANLTEAQCIGTDFTAAQLTGATLEAWNIDNTTILTNVDCDFAYLKEHPDALGNRERLPHNPDKTFAPGDFEKYFREVIDEVKLLIRGGVDPTAFKFAFQQLMAQHNITPNNVYGIEKKGSNVLVTITVPPKQSKGDIERTFDTNYKKALPSNTAQALLETERKSHKEFIDFANKSIDSISTVLSNLTINTTAMTNNNSPNITTGDGSFYTGGDVSLTGSILNLGEINGQVTNQINQLPSTNTEQPRLKDLLTQLQKAIDQDTELSDDEKAEALGEVIKLAKAGTEPKESKMQNLAKRATNTLTAIAETLTDASKLRSACKTLLPMILTWF